MHQRSWKTLIAGGAALAVGVTLTAFGAPAHAAGVPVITSEARAQDEVMNYAVNLTAEASPSVSGRPRSRGEAWAASVGSVSRGECLGCGRTVGGVKQVQMSIWRMVTVWVFTFWHVVIA